MRDIISRIFCQLQPDGKSCCCERCFERYQIKEFQTGDYIAYRGQVASSLYILIEGSVDVETVLNTGLLLAVRHHEAPYPMGAVALFAQENIYRVNVVALQPCRVAVISKSEVEQQMARCRRFLGSYIAYNTSKLDLFIEHLTLLTQKNLKAKVALYLLTQSKNGEFKLGRSITELATYLCVERPSLSRTIGELVKSGMITHNRGQGKIVNIAALEELIV